MSEKLNEFVDASGRITVAVFRQRAGNEQQHFHDHAANVPDDMIAIGGGAEAVEVPNGALLTASYPNNNLTAWLASSKDHVVAQPHRLITYAIGLRINGLSREQLLSHVHITTQDSGSASHPESSATMRNEFLLVSGGFKVEWNGAGNLATASFPETDNSWMSRSKDHEVESHANLKTFAIGLRRTLPVGSLVGSIQQQQSVQAAHPSCSADVPSGFVLTGVGARVNWSGAGNLLWKMVPTTHTANQEITVASKDHNIGSPATITAFALGIRLT